MKTYNKLWEIFISKENFELAYKNAIKGKAKQKQVQKFKLNAEENLEKIRQSVINGQFHTSKYQTMIIYEPKKRIIYKLPFAPDRIVQHAVMNILKPIFIKKFIANTFACVDGRGQHTASIKCSEYVRKNTYCLKCDIRKFYPSIDHNILYSMISKFITDEKFLNIIQDIIYSVEGGKNCPIGNYCSQWLGNFYLSKLDNFIKHKLKCKHYERYCDDFLLFSNDKQYLKWCKEEIRQFLNKELKLEYSKADLFNTKQGVDFCGYRHFGKYVLLRKSTCKRLKKRLKRINNPLDFAESIASTRGWLKWCCSYNLINSIPILKTSFSSPAPHDEF